MAQVSIPMELLTAYRRRAFRRLPKLRVTDEQSALDFIEEAGFLFLWTDQQSLDLPSLSTAFEDRDEWVWWEMKQTLPAKKACYYGKILRSKGTFISWRFFPDFYALYADPDAPPGPVEKRLLDVLSEAGPLGTKELRLAYGPPGKANTRRVNQALVRLQRRFLVSPAGGDTEGWSHHLWDLTERWTPQEHLKTAAQTAPQDAARRLVYRLLQNLGVTNVEEIMWLFGWEREAVQNALECIKGIREVGLKGIEGRFFSTRGVLNMIANMRVYGRG